MLEWRSAFAVVVAVTTASCDAILGLNSDTVIVHGDANVSPDTGSDATGADAGCPSPSFCANEGGAHMFCQDFDEGSLGVGVDGGWDNSNVNVAGGLSALDPSAFTSCPASFLASAPAVVDAGASGGTGVTLVRAFGTANDGLSTSFDVQVDAAGGDCVAAPAGMDLAEVLFATASYRLTFRFTNPPGADAASAHFQLNEFRTPSGPGNDHDLNGGTGPGWHHVSIAVSLSGEGTANIVIDGTATQVTFAQLPTGVTFAPALLIGTSVSNHGSSTACSVNFDNVTFDVN